MNGMGRICWGDIPDVMGAPMAVRALMMMVRLNRSRQPSHHIDSVTSMKTP